MTTYEEVRAGVREIATLRTQLAREEAADKLISRLFTLLSGLEAANPARADALLEAYANGGRTAIALVRATCQEHEDTFRAARTSAAGVVLQGVALYGQFIASDAERRWREHFADVSSETEKTSVDKATADRYAALPDLVRALLDHVRSCEDCDGTGLVGVRGMDPDTGLDRTEMAPCPSCEDDRTVLRKAGVLSVDTGLTLPHSGGHKP